LSRVSSKFCCLLAFVAILLPAGCGGGGEEAVTGKASVSTQEDSAANRSLRVSLDDVEGAENVGIVMAVKRGYFEDVGLDVWAGSPLEPSRPVQYVAKGIDDFGVTQQPQVVIGKEKGADLVAVGSLVSQPTAAMIWLKGSKIGGLADLKGKTIGFPGVPFQKGMLQAVLSRVGLTLEDVQVRNLRYEMASGLVEGRVDAIFGGSWNLEGVELETAGAEPVITRVQELGVPDYEEGVVVAPADLVDENPQLIRDFMSAVARGTQAAIQDPKAAAAAIKEAIGAVPDLHRKDREAQLKATLPLLSRSGYMSPDRARGLVDWMYEEELIKRRWPPEALLTNAYR
jgi:putative hydroxymethylpyrimidine transport system substrate-binding protein